LGLLTCKNRLPYNLYCVGGDIKRCIIQSKLTDGSSEVTEMNYCCNQVHVGLRFLFFNAWESFKLAGVS